MVTQISDWNDLDAEIQGSNGVDNSTNYELTQTLDEDTAGYDGVGDSWTPPGEVVTDNQGDGYEGVFDGGGHSIRDLVINDDSVPYPENAVGFFGNLRFSAVVKNLGVAGTINIDTDGTEVGMLAGDHTGDEIKNCFVAGSIDAPDQTLTGGVFGRSLDKVTDSYSVVDINGETVGGFGGRSNNGTIKRCYSSGTLADGSTSGFLRSSVDSTETDCFFDSDEAGTSSTDGDATPLSTAEMQGASASSNLSGFDFTNDWKTVEGGSNSDIDGYPYLRALSAHQQSDIQEARFEPFSITIVGTNSPVNADDELTVDVEVTNDGDFEGDAEIDLIVEET